jgi:hypothetical protein
MRLISGSRLCLCGVQATFVCFPPASIPTEHIQTHIVMCTADRDTRLEGLLATEWPSFFIAETGLHAGPPPRPLCCSFDKILGSGRPVAGLVIVVKVNVAAILKSLLTTGAANTRSRLSNESLKE